MNTLILMGLAGFAAWVVYGLIDRYMPKKSFKNAVIISKQHESCVSTTLNHTLSAQRVDAQKYMLTLRLDTGQEMLEEVSAKQYHRAMAGQNVKIAILNRRFTQGLRGFIGYEFKF